MDKTQVDQIETCAAEVARKRLAVDCFMNMNAFGRSVDETIEIQQKYAIAQAELIEAENALNEVMPKRKP